LTCTPTLCILVRKQVNVAAACVPWVLMAVSVTSDDVGHPSVVEAGFEVLALLAPGLTPGPLLASAVRSALTSQPEAIILDNPGAAKGILRFLRALQREGSLGKSLVCTAHLAVLWTRAWDMGSL
jgi:hypothetical protein